MKIISYNIKGIDLDLLNNTYNLINNKDRKRIDKVVNKDQKDLSIMSLYLLIKGLKEFYNLDYNNLCILKNKNGKPYIKNSNIYFNISHSGYYVVCAFSNNKIGIDIEMKRDVSFNMFSSNEIVDNNILKTFILKESYLKMKGSSVLKIKDNILNKKIDAKFICLASNDYIISICEYKN